MSGNTAPDLDRDEPVERARIRAAADLLDAAVAGERLLELAHDRVEPGPVRDIDTRDFAGEGLEELADLLNYGNWLIAQLERAGHDDLTGPVYSAMGHAIVASERLHVVAVELMLRG